MNELADVQRYLLTGSAVFLLITIFCCLLRAALGPRFTDRITAANMIVMKVIMLTAVLALIIGEGYLVDICLIYAVINFVTVVVILGHKEEGKNS